MSILILNIPLFQQKINNYPSAGYRINHHSFLVQLSFIINMKIIITRLPNFTQQHYCLLQFKGKFETEELPTKSIVHVGTLHKTSNEEYRLEIGIMDLVGKSTKLEEGWLYTQTIDSNNYDQKIILVKGVITQKIIFDKRPCPNMERAEIEPKIHHTNNLFRNMEIRANDS